MLSYSTSSLAWDISINLTGYLVLNSEGGASLCTTEINLGSYKAARDAE